MKSLKLQSETQNWEVKKLEEVANITSGGTPSRKKPGYFKGKIPWVKSGELKDSEIYQTEECISEDGLKNSSAKLLSINTILIAMYGATVGKTGILKAPATTNQAIASIQVNPKIANHNFIYFILRTKVNFLLNRRFGGAQPNINQNIIKNLKIFLPPLEIQQEIVERLDAIRKAQELNDKHIALAEELFQSLLYRELDPQGKNWEVKRLGEVSKVKGGKRVPKGKRLIDAKTNHPYIRVVDFKDFSVDLLNLKYIDDETFRVIKNYTISEDEIYVSIAGTTGLAGTIPAVLDGANLTENAAKLILRNKDLEKMFLVYFLASDFGQLQLQRSTYAPGIPKLALYRLERVKIPIPPLETQRQIVQKLRAVQDYKKSIFAQKGKLQELFESTLDKSMIGEF